MPILAIVLTTPLTAALMNFLTATLWSVSAKSFFAHQIRNRLVSEIGIDGGAAVANQNGEMMHLARFAGFEDQTDLRARAAADEMVMQTGNRQQRGNRRERRADATVGKHDYICAVNNGLVRRVKNNVERVSQTFCAVGDLEQNRQRDVLKPGRSMWRSFSNSSFVRIG